MKRSRRGFTVVELVDAVGAIFSLMLLAFAFAIGVFVLAALYKYVNS